VDGLLLPVAETIGGPAAVLPLESQAVSLLAVAGLCLCLPETRPGVLVAKAES